MSIGENKEELTGFVDHIIFRNDENGYTVLLLDGDITVTGVFPSINEGESLRMWGEYVFHAVYGEQFNCHSFEIIIPSDEDDIRRYLSSGVIKGIGPALANRIVDKFHEKTLDIMENEPERLAEIKGISENKARDISELVLEKTRDRAAILYLMRFGIKNTTAMKIYKYYGQKIYVVMENNPYKLSEDIKGIGFKMADEIAKKTGIRYDEDNRNKSGILYILGQNSLRGHTYILHDNLIEQCVNLLDAQVDTLKANLMQLSIDKKIIIRGEKIYLYYYYKMEAECASMLLGLDVSFDKDDDYVDRFLQKEEKDMNMPLDEYQKRAVHTAAKKGVFVLTGGPGTGKTTTIRTIIEYFEGIDCMVSLCAPTGRAAKRMTESTGREAMTIHRLLEVTGGTEDDDLSNERMFLRGRDYPLESDVVIVDEASMVDIFLLYSLLKAVPLETRLILVGDMDQLPSVGPGNVLKDIIESDKFSVVRLINIFRQKERSDIVLNAHRIQNKEYIDLGAKSQDFFFLKRDDATSIIKTTLTLIRKKLPNYVQAQENEIQVLTPTRKGTLGVESLNKSLQQYLNPRENNKAEHQFGERIFREKDKVMQIKNNYQIPWRIENEFGYIEEEGLGIYNGDMGVIKSINEFAKIITIEFDDKKIVDYSFNQIDEIEHSFAVTVHKSQGSEYPAVIIPLFNVPRMLMNRNLIYTAITRARRLVVLIGEENIFRQMVENDTVLKRYSSLKEMLMGQ